mgnify:CR=1 FL=1
MGFLADQFDWAIVFLILAAIITLVFGVIIGDQPVESMAFTVSWNLIIR